MDRTQSNRETQLGNLYSRRGISIYRNLFWSWISKSNNYSKRNNSRINNRHNLNISTVTGAILIGLLSPTKAIAETVGGVSATAAPVANSSGSVTNQAIQVLQGPYITNTYGGGIQCQGPTLNITPYVTGAASAQKPYEPYYYDPVYDVTDNFGAFDDDGRPIGDGILDNPGNIIFRKKVRTGQKDTYNLSLGVSATWSIPQDKKLQDQCKEAAATQIALQQQLTANKRLDFEIARLKNCGELMKQGISFHPRSPYYKICADVVVQNVTEIKPHRHTIPSLSKTSKRASKNAEDLGVPLQIKSQVLYP